MPAPTVTEASPIIASPGNSKNIESPWYEPYSEINALDYPGSPIVSGKEFGDPVCETLDSLEKNKGNDHAGWLLNLSLDELTKDRDELCDKNQSTSSTSEF